MQWVHVIGKRDSPSVSYCLFEFCCVCKEGLLVFSSTTGMERQRQTSQCANAYPLMWQVPDVDLSWNSWFKLLRALTLTMRSSVCAGSDLNPLSIWVCGNVVAQRQRETSTLSCLWTPRFYRSLKCVNWISFHPLTCCFLLCLNDQFSKSSTFYFSFLNVKYVILDFSHERKNSKCYFRVSKWMTLAILGRNRWNKLMRHRVSSGRTCSVSHV